MFEIRSKYGTEIILDIFSVCTAVDNHHGSGLEEWLMSRLLHEIDRNQEHVRTIDGAIVDIEMIQALQPDALGSDAFSIALYCMRIQRNRLLSHVSKLKALQESMTSDPVADALLRQRHNASGYDVVADAEKYLIEKSGTP